MSGNITTSNFKKIPIALLIALILVIASEALIYSNRAELITDFWNKFLINEQNLIGGQKNFDYLIVGDSIQKTGIDPKLVSDKLLNLGLPGGKPMSLYLLLERYLKNHEPPKVIFLYVDPEDPHDSLYVILRYFVAIPEFFSVWKDLSWRERLVFLMRYWASLDLRKVGLTIRDKYPYSNKIFLNELLKNRGFMPSPRSHMAITENHFRVTRERVNDAVSISDKDMEYLDKFMKLAASKNIKIVFLGFLMPKELLAIMELTGFNAKYKEFFESLKARYPEADFVSEPILYLDNGYFGDPSHLNSKGAMLFTDYFKKEVFDRYENM